MKYIEEDENVTLEYEIVIDELELKKVIEELNEKCCRSVKVNVNIRAEEDRALENFNSIGKKAVDIVRKGEDSKNKYFYECEYYRKQVSYLQYLLSGLMHNYRRSADVSGAVRQLIAYENSDELKTYQERMAENGITQELYDEYENNKNFDFALLRELYKRARDCFKLILVSKTIHYTTNEKVKKLGGK